MKKKRILLTGATGYVGGKLLRRLEAEGHEVNCLVRKPNKLKILGPNTHLFQGDVLERSSMWEAFKEVHTAYFMVHFLNEKENFETKEIQAAENFSSMARSAGVKRIIYLGALGNEQDRLSAHLRSRQDVGYILRSSGVQTLELRASIVLGEGSLSYELIKDLTENLPFMITPRWVSTQAQPIGIRDLLDYLVQAANVPLVRNEIIEIGGSDQMSYGDLMREYAQQRGLKRAMLPVPALTPWLSSHWVAFFSRVDHHLAGKLIEGIRNPTVIESDRAHQFFNIKPLSAREAIHEAVQNLPPEEEANLPVIQPAV